VCIANQTLQETVSEQRAWVRGRIIPAGNFVFDKDGGKLMVRYSFANKGKWVASKVWMFSKILAQSVEEKVTLPKPDDNFARPANQASVGIVLFPNDSTTTDMTYTIPISWADIRKAQPVEGGPVMLTLTACIDYVLADDTHHQTCLGYIIGVATNHGRSAPSPMVGSVIPDGTWDLEETPGSQTAI